MELLKYLWKYLLSVLVLAFSWIFFIFGVLLSAMLIFLWCLHLCGIYPTRISPICMTMSFGDFYQTSHMGIFLLMALVGLLGVYLFYHGKNLVKLMTG